jgi:4-hydroxy-tetrahydrodipicolinate synthase
VGAEAAAAAGADALLLVTPPYNKPTPAGLVAHFAAVAAAGGGLPIVFYNVPGRTAYDASPAVIAAVAAAVPEVIAVKEATGSMERAAQCLEQFGERMTTLSGDDFSLLPFYALGGHGCISVLANLAPARCVALRAATLAGDFEKAREIHYQLRPVSAALFAATNPIPVKMAMAEMGLCGATMRLPLVPLDDTSALKSALAGTELR